MISELKEAGTVFFPRSVVLESTQEEKPIVLGFGDGSTSGFAAVVYVVSKCPCEGHQVLPIIAKARVAPLTGTTTPRIEMSSAALLAKLSILVIKSVGFSPREVVMALDSECSVAALKKRDGLLKPYFAHRRRRWRRP